MDTDRISYELCLTQSFEATGYFACYPPRTMDFEACLEHLGQCPNDEFMHKHLLRLIGAWSQTDFKKRLPDSVSNPLLSTLVYEACLLNAHLTDSAPVFSGDKLRKMAENSPLIYIRSSLLTDAPLHARWIQILGDNIRYHRDLPPLSKIGPAPVQVPLTAQPRVQIQDIPVPSKAKQTPKMPSFEETSRLALDRLSADGIIAGEEMRHTASLSPIALLRPWSLSITVKNGRNHFSVSGIQTAYGRGLSLERARASYAMEMVERYSAFSSVEPAGLTGYCSAYPLIRARYSDLLRSGQLALDPNRIGLEVPYIDQPLHWLQGNTVKAGVEYPLLVPVQCVLLFCNLDEPSLFSGLGSTGLASGNTLPEAKVSALLEIVERHAEGVSPYRPDQCFHLVSRDAAVANLLEDYRRKGIHVRFQDLSHRFGIPVCKAFVVGQDGGVAKGFAAHLDARIAALSALTETPYPYPGGSASVPFSDSVLHVCLQDLPDYSTGSPTGDLFRIESLLAANGLEPVYIDLTRKNLGIPVVKALVPGLEVMADFDGFSRVSPELFSNYLNMFP